MRKSIKFLLIFLLLVLIAFATFAFVLNKSKTCEDSECDDNNTLIEDMCENAGSENAICMNTAKNSLKGFIGIKNIAIVEFIAPNIQNWPEWGGYSFIELLNNKEQFKYFENPQPSRNIYSINYVSNFFGDEANKYNKNLNLDISIIGPYYLDEFPPLDPVKRNQQVYLNVSYLRNYAEQQGANLNNFEKWIPLYLYNYYDLDGQEGTILHPNSGAISFPIDTREYPSAEMITTIAHEVAHLYGATDQYVSYSCKDPDGVPNPGVYPQSKACVMCPAIAMEKEGSTYGITDMNQVIVCDKAAEEFGWK